MNQEVMNTHSLEGAIMINNPEQQQEKRLKSLPEQSLKCPRCDSTNTKFCYYNNYSLSQPRYFCKGCRRYWTQGGSLRNVPVGGGCRRNKKSSSSSTSSSSSPASSSITSKRVQDDTLLAISCPQIVLPSLPTPHLLTHYSLQTNYDPLLLANSNPPPMHNSNAHGFLDILRSGFLENCSSGGLQSFYHGFGLDEKQVVPNTDESSCCKNSVDSEWQISGLDGNLSLDSGRDFWGSVGFGSIGGSSSVWQGLVNSSLM